VGSIGHASLVVLSHLGLEKTNLSGTPLMSIGRLTTHPKDLFLYLIQLALAALFFAFSAIFLYGFRLLILAKPLIDLLQLTVIILFALAALLSFLGFFEAGRMSEKKIDATKERIQNQIDDINHRLKPPA